LLKVRFSPRGHSPNSLSAADLNGDGKLDLVTANEFNAAVGSATVSVLLGNGDGTFGPNTIYPTNGFPALSVTTGDFNGDGKVDLAVGTENPGSVSILLGNGDGTFAPKVDFLVPGTADALLSGDFNQDGKLDLAVANHVDANGFVSILLNTCHVSGRPKLFVNGHMLGGPELDNVLFVATKVVPQLLGSRAERIRVASIAGWWGLREGTFGLPDVGSHNAFVFSLCDAPKPRTHLGPLQVCPTGVAWQVGLAAAFVPNFTEQEVLDTVQIIWPTRTVTDVLAEAAQTAGFDPTGTTGGAIVASIGALQESWLLRHTVVRMTLEQPIITGRCVQPAMPPRDCIGVQPGNPDSKLYAATKEDMLRSISDLAAIFDGISP
jgi:hypothetical protein